MFPPLSNRKMAGVLRDRMLQMAHTAMEFATLGEAFSQARIEPASAPTAEHPHRRKLSRPQRAGRPGTIAPRPQVCRTPVSARPQGSGRTPKPAVAADQR
jgi:hypothetical protein